VLLTVGSSFGSVDVAPVMAPDLTGSAAPELIGSLESSGWPAEKLASVRELAAKMALFAKPVDRLFSLKVGTVLAIDEPDVAPHPRSSSGVALSEPSVIEGAPLVETLHAMIAAVETIVVSFKALLE
jgi:hypothetical protein